jgi:methionyl-tRNA formyltransferase
MDATMRIVFAGTPHFAEHALTALLKTSHEIVLVLTQPDRPAGRGLKMVSSAVKVCALKSGIPVFQPPTLRDPAAIDQLRALVPDVLVVAAYGLILPPSVLELARLGAVNIHASLLPRWRGAAPIQRAILAGDHETGITIMQMDAGLDTGPILARTALEIAIEDTASTLHDKLATLGATMIVQTLDTIDRGQAHPAAQPAVGITYAAKIAKGEARLDWRKPAAELDRAVRAFNPFPGAFTSLRGETIKIWRAGPVDQCGPAGTVLGVDPSGVVVGCGAGALLLLEMQRTGGKRLATRDFLRGHPMASGDVLDLITD